MTSTELEQLNGLLWRFLSECTKVDGALRGKVSEVRKNVARFAGRQARREAAA